MGAVMTLMTPPPRMTGHLPSAGSALGRKAWSSPDISQRFDGLST